MYKFSTLGTNLTAFYICYLAPHVTEMFTHHRQHNSLFLFGMLLVLCTNVETFKYKNKNKSFVHRRRPSGRGHCS